MDDGMYGVCPLSPFNISPVTQGGGHSVLSPSLGLGVDRIVRSPLLIQ